MDTCTSLTNIVPSQLVLTFVCRFPFIMPSRKEKEKYLYSAILVHTHTLKALRHGSHSFTCKQHHAGLSFVSIHLMAPPQQLRQQTSNCSSLLIYRRRRDERLSWPGWLTYSGWLTHIIKWSSISYKSSAGQRKHIGQRPMLYRWTTPPTPPTIKGVAIHPVGRPEFSL